MTAMNAHYHALLNAPVITPAEYRALLRKPILTQQEQRCRERFEICGELNVCPWALTLGIVALWYSDDVERWLSMEW